MFRILSLMFLVYFNVQDLYAAYPDAQDTLINDFVHVIEDAHGQQIRHILTRLKSETGVEATVVTIGSIYDYPVAATSIEDFATGLFNQWGIGNAETNNGILLLVAVKDRKVRIEFGGGYGDRANGAAESIIQEKIVPRFKLGDYSQGILEGISEIAAIIPARMPSTRKEDSPSIYQALVALPVWASLTLAGLFSVILGFVVAKIMRMRKRRCAKCRAPMRRLGEQEDDSHLDGGQTLEESLQSVDYDVWVCGSCETVKVIPYKKWFSGYSECPQCRYRSYYISHSETEPASYSSTGLETIHRRCKKCDYSRTETVVIPRLEQDTSSSSSYDSGSSFGGGSSSGGGASGNW